jgi:hypothetical protein
MSLTLRENCFTRSGQQCVRSYVTPIMLENNERVMKEMHKRESTRKSDAKARAVLRRTRQFS